MNSTPTPLEDAALPTTNPSDTGANNSTMRLSPDFNSEDSSSGDEVDSGSNGSLELGGDEAASESGSDEVALSSDGTVSELGIDEHDPEPSSDEVGPKPDSNAFGAEFQKLLHHLTVGGSDMNGGVSASIPFVLVLHSIV
jgi:hypothetical protein